MVSELPVDLFEEILLRLDDVADLARTSAVCASFHRIVSDGRFLRRFRSLQRRPVLGFLANDPHETALFYAAQPPRRSAQAAAYFVKAADFNFNFLPDPSRRWRVCDVRAGRVLLTWRPTFRSMFEDLVVYDPLHRRHVHIPTIPGDLIPVGDEEDDDDEAILFDSPITFDTPFLAPAVDDVDDNESFLRFQVMCIAMSKTGVVAFVFSSASGQWRRAASFHDPRYDWTWIAYWLCFRQHVDGCVCWVNNAINLMLVFDTHEMKFWITDLPHENIGKYKMAVEAEDGRLGLLLLNKECMTMHLYSKAKQGQGIEEPEEWRLDSSIPIMSGFYWTMLTGVTEGYALLLGFQLDQAKDWIRTHNKKPEKAHYFTLDLKTLQVEKLCVLEYDETQTSFLYASFPPLFSSSSV